MKKKKNELDSDSVQSDNFHVGIELELKLPCDGGSDSHDDDSCSDSAYESQKQYLNDIGDESILREYFDLTRDEAQRLANYFDSESWINDYMNDWQWDGCQDGSDCSYRSQDGDNAREDLQSELVSLTNNTSFKVVEDSSISTDDSETDAEVCWNYFASKDTIKDNTKIMKLLKNKDCNFDSSCGLHINLNNYLDLPNDIELSKESLKFLFNFVAKSRRDSRYCNDYGMSSDSKYSMIYHQKDRLEFRFFSPTLEADKLNHYVTLAHTIYKRLAGKNAKLPKKSATYFMDKMVKINKLDSITAQETINLVNNIESLESIKVKQAIERENERLEREREDEIARQANAAELVLRMSEAPQWNLSPIEAIINENSLTDSLVDGCNCDICVQYGITQIASNNGEVA